MSRSQPPSAKLLQILIRYGFGKLSPRWWALLAALIVGYLLLLPIFERSLGWDLPGFADFTAAISPAPLQDAASPPSQKRANAPPQQTSSRQPSLVPATPPSKPHSATLPSQQELAQILQLGGRQEFVSPAGLRYRRGSQQGHRLKHLMRHAQDEPDRPGSHGVFDQATAIEIVRLVDQAYLQAKSGKNTQTKQEGQRTIHTVNLHQRIGYVGGQTGQRNNHPAAKHLRLVLDGTNFITAFPIRL